LEFGFRLYPYISEEVGAAAGAGFGIGTARSPSLSAFVGDFAGGIKRAVKTFFASRVRALISQTVE